jgi:hypothetical protein
VTRLRLLPEAEAELADAARWYEARRGGLGAELVVEVDRALEVIREAPRAAPLWKEPAPYRRVVLARFP